MSYDRPTPPPPAAGAPTGTEPRPSGRGRALLPTLVILGVMVALFALFVGYYTDWLWYSSVGYSSVFTKQLWVRALLFVAFFLVAAVTIGVNGYLAYRYRPIFRAISLEQQSLDRYRLALDPFRKLLLTGLAAVIGFFFGVAAMSQWSTLLAWLNRTAFGTTDPQFNVDISFYVFTMPWLRFLLDSAMGLVIISGLIAAAVHYLYGGISTHATEKFAPAARIHLSILIGAFLLLKAASYWLDRYELVVTTNSLFTGAGYTDVNAVLPAKTILTFVALICAVLFFINAARGTWRLALLGLGLMVLSAVVIGGIYPQLVQRLQVSPSEDVKESPYITRNIDATREAYGLDDVASEPYAAQVTPDSQQVREARGTIQNVRVMDPGVLPPTFDQLQQVKGFYRFQEPLDVDRYTVDGKQADVVVAPREIDLTGVPEGQRNWINDHLTYTHGFGLVAAYGNRADATGEPEWAESDLPPVGVLDVEQPRIYLGEHGAEYSIVGDVEGAAPRELDYPDATAENGQRSYTYTGEGGVSIGSFFNRIVYAWKFQETNILLSDSINPESRILYTREPLERVEQVAPWLTLDGDPFATVIDGRLVWIVDGYTTSGDYPYSERQAFGEATTDSLNAQSSVTQPVVQDQVNYIRNSVKATVDAYDGTVTLYEWDETDPILQTWSKAFPGTVAPKSEISDELLAHLRYPQDLFKLQRETWARYHVSEAATWYTSQDAWQVPNDPTDQGVGDVPQPPYYLTLRMPDTPAASFSLTTTYAPVNRQNLASFMAVNSDATDPDYGVIRVLELPDNSPIPGPSQMQNNFDSDPNVANELLALRRGGNVETELGNLLTLPVANGLMYVEPVFVRATEGTSFPTLRKVMVSFGNEIAIEDTFPEALAVFFEAIEGRPGPGNGGDGGGGDGGGGGGGDTDASAQARLTQALADAQSAYEAGQTALAEGDFAAYGVAQDELFAALQRAEEAAAELGLELTPTPDGEETTPAPEEETTPPSEASADESTSSISYLTELAAVVPSD